MIHIRDMKICIQTYERMEITILLQILLTNFIDIAPSTLPFIFIMVIHFIISFYISRELLKFNSQFSRGQEDKQLISTLWCPQNCFKIFLWTPLQGNSFNKRIPSRAIKKSPIGAPEWLSQLGSDSWFWVWSWSQGSDWCKPLHWQLRAYLGFSLPSLSPCHLSHTHSLKINK